MAAANHKLLASGRNSRVFGTETVSYVCLKGQRAEEKGQRAAPLTFKVLA